MMNDKDLLNMQLVKRGRRMYKDIDERTERSLRQYLECEALMNEFFGEVNYCHSNCISQPKSKNLKIVGIRGDVGCCLYNNHEFRYGIDRWRFSFDPKDAFYLDLKKSEDELILKRIYLNYEKVQLFIKKRKDKYGQPKNSEEPLDESGERPCDYHTKNGCLLKDFKSPICISHTCEDFQQYLKRNFGIDYDKLGTSIFYKILNEDLDYDEVEENEVNEFKSKINAAIKKVKEKKSKK